MEQNRISLKNLDTCKATPRTSSANICSRSSYLLNVTSPPFSSARFTLNTETCTHYSWSSAVWVITMHAIITIITMSSQCMQHAHCACHFVTQVITSHALCAHGTVMVVSSGASSQSVQHMHTDYICNLPPCFL